MGKSLNLAEALDGFTAARKLNPGGHALFHSRWATHGGITTANVHPFTVGRQGGLTVVGHNGILPAAAHPAKGDSRSDTRKFADEILSTRYRRLDKVRAFSALTNWIGSYNKLVILTVNPRYRKNAYIVNERAGHWDQHTGLWHSNLDYLFAGNKWASYYPQTIGSKYRTPSSKATVTELPELCYICEYGHYGNDGYCDECESCEDCMEWRHDCLCFVPEGERRDADEDEFDGTARLRDIIAEEDRWSIELAQRKNFDFADDYS